MLAMRTLLGLVLIPLVSFAQEASVLRQSIAVAVDPGTGRFVSQVRARVRGPGRVPLPDVPGLTAEPDRAHVDEGEHEVAVRIEGLLTARFADLQVGSAPGYFLPVEGPCGFRVEVRIPESHRAVSEGERVEEDVKDAVYRVVFQTERASGGPDLVLGRWKVEERGVGPTICRVYLRDDDGNGLLDGLAVEVGRLQGLLGPLPLGRFDVYQDASSREEIRDGFCAAGTPLGHALAAQWFKGLRGPVQRHPQDPVAQGFGLFLAANLDENAALRGRYLTRISLDSEAVAQRNALLFVMLRRRLAPERFVRLGHDLAERAANGPPGWNPVLEAAPWIEPWLRDGRPAPVLRTGILRVEDRTVVGTILQEQEGEVFSLRVPVRIETEAGVEEFEVACGAKETLFRHRCESRPKRLHLDPEATLLRSVPRERVAPCVLATRTAARTTWYGVPTLGDEFREPDAAGLPMDAAVIAIGLPAAQRKTMLRDARIQEPSLDIGNGFFEIAGKRYDRDGDILVFSYRRRTAPAFPVTFVHANRLERHEPGLLLEALFVDSEQVGWSVQHDSQVLARRFYDGDRATRLRITAGRQGPPERLLQHLLMLIDQAYKGRRTGAGASFKLANNLRGALFRAGPKPLSWPSVDIPTGRLVGERQLSLISGDEVTYLPDSYFPFHRSAAPKNAPVFDRVVKHPASDVKNALVLLPEDSPVKTARDYARRGAAVIGVVSSTGDYRARAQEAAWEGAMPPWLEDGPPELTSGWIMRSAYTRVGAPYLYFSPEAARALENHGGQGVVKYRIRFGMLSTSNIVGVFGNPRARGILLSAPWDGNGPQDDCSAEQATGAAVVLWVAEQLKRDHERGRLRRPVVFSLFGGSGRGECGSQQFAMVLKSPQPPLALPVAAVNLAETGSSLAICGGTADLREAVVSAGTGEKLEVASHPDLRIFDHWPLADAGIPALSIHGPFLAAETNPFAGLGAIDIDAMRRTARAVYRLVRDLATRE